MHTVGRHLLVELYDCDEASLDSVDAVRDAVRAATAATGATIVGETYHRFAPHGVSSSVLIAESHFSLHTWPEAGYAAADIFTCGDLDPRPGVAALGRCLRAQSCRVVEIVRGLAADIESPTLKLPKDVRRITRLTRAVPLPGE